MIMEKQITQIRHKRRRRQRDKHTKYNVSQ